MLNNHLDKKMYNKRNPKALIDSIFIDMVQHSST